MNKKIVLIKPKIVPISQIIAQMSTGKKLENIL